MTAQTLVEGFYAKPFSGKVFFKKQQKQGLARTLEVIDIAPMTKSEIRKLKSNMVEGGAIAKFLYRYLPKTTILTCLVSLIAAVFYSIVFLGSIMQAGMNIAAEFTPAFNWLSAPAINSLALIEALTYMVIFGAVFLVALFNAVAGFPIWHKTPFSEYFDAVPREAERLVGKIRRDYPSAEFFVEWCAGDPFLVAYDVLDQKKAYYIHHWNE